MNSTTNVQQQLRTTELLLFSARSRGELIEQLRNECRRAPATGLAELAGRLADSPAERYRLAIIVKIPADLAARVDQATKLLSAPEHRRFNLANEIYYDGADEDDQQRKTAFLFSGYGARHSRLMADLYAELPVVQDWFDELGLAHRKRFRRNELLFPSGNAAGTGPMEPMSQDPALHEVLDAILVTNLAMFTLVSRLGLACDAMAGHSYGEIAMLHASGLVGDCEDVADLLLRVGLALQEPLSHSAGSAGDSGMLALSAKSRSLLDEAWIKQSSSVFLALDNCPQQAILWGTQDELSRLEAIVKQRGEICFRIPGLNYPVHTPKFPIPESRLRQIYERLVITPATARIYSCSTATVFPERPDDIRELLARQWVTPVRFRETIRRLYDDGIRTFVELGSGDRLTGFARDILRGTDAVAVATNLENRGTLQQLQIFIAQLFVRGYSLNLPAVFGDRQTDSQRLSGAARNRRGAGDNFDPAARETSKTESDESASRLDFKAGVRMAGAGQAGSPGSGITGVSRSAPTLATPSTSSFPTKPDVPEDQSNTAKRVSDEFRFRLGALDRRERRRLLVAHVLQRVSEIMGMTGIELLDPETGFFDLGMNSLGCVELSEKLQLDLEIPLQQTLAFDFPSVAQMAARLSEMLDPAPVVDARRSIGPGDASGRNVADAVAGGHEPIAIIGIGCRFPGHINTPDEFLRLLMEGRDAVTEVPPGRWNTKTVFGPDNEDPNTSTTRFGGFLEKIDEFDPAFFGISPREATTLDPQQRLLLELTWEALEHAAIDPQRLAGSRTGVFVGISSNDYAQRLSMDERLEINGYLGTGNTGSTAAGRISYVFGFNGPCLAVDTACSSSLVAVHLACRSLRLGEGDMAIAGGVNLLISPETSIYLHLATALSGDGRCKTFDAAADGYVRAEGCGVIALKRLSDAMAAADNILAVISGSAVNHGGKTSGLTVPSGPAQEAVVRSALNDAGLKPEQIGYIEAHGTGTSLGDPIEVRALTNVFGTSREPDNPLMIGSVKTNIGHLEAAAGIAGLIKLVLQLQHRAMAPNLHFREPNPKINWSATPFQVCRKAISWDSKRAPLIGGVSSFGISGTNAHVVVSQAPESTSSRAIAADFLAPEKACHVLTISGKSCDALAHLASSFRQHLANGSHPSLGDVCFSSNLGRAHFPLRRAIVAESFAEVEAQLREVTPADFLAREAIRPLRHTRPKVAFLFTGQGAHYAGMGRQMFESEPVFRSALAECDEILRSFLDRPLLQTLFDQSTRQEPVPAFPNKGVSPLPVVDRQFDAHCTEGGRPLCGAKPPDQLGLLDQATYAQPALFSFEFALCRLWSSWGIEPDVVMGHSLGEYVAACVAGVFSLADALRLVAARGRLMQSLPPGGAMLAVKASCRQLGPYLERFDGISIAAVNGEHSIVLSGADAQIAEVRRQLDATKVASTPLNVSHGFHSVLMEPILEDFQRTAADIAYSAPRVPLISNLTGRQAGSSIASAQYWTKHLRHTVRFADGMRTLEELNCELYVEVGPRPVLSAMGADCLVKSSNGRFLPSLHPPIDERRQMLESLGKLYEAGFDVNWKGFHSGCHYRRLPLPHYPFDRALYWLDRPVSRRHASAIPHSDSNGSLLGTRMRLPGLDTQIRFEAALPTSTASFLDDCRLHGHRRLPLSAYVAMAAAAGKQVYHADDLAIEELVIADDLIIHGNAPVLLHTVLDSLEDGGHRIRIYSLAAEIDEDQPSAVLRFTAVIRKLEPFHRPSRFDQPRMTNVEDGSLRIDKQAYYRACRHLGIDVGDTFQVIELIRIGRSGALASLALPDVAATEWHEERLRMTVLDGCFQSLAATLYRPDEHISFRVKRIGRVRLFGGPETSSTAVISHERGEAQGSSLIAGLTLIGQADRQTLVEFEGVEFERIALPAERTAGGAAECSRTLKMIRKAPVESRREVLIEYLQKLLANILRNRSALNISHPFNQLGMDSLMASGLSAALQIELAVAIPTVDLLKGHGLASLAEAVLQQWDDPDVAAVPVTQYGGAVRATDNLSEGWVEGEL